MKKSIIILISVLVTGGVIYFYSSPKEAGDIANAHPMISVEAPKSGETISSPVKIRGEARGPWFFEASFSVVLVDSERTMIGETVATAKGEWMTEEFVPFEADLYFELPLGIESDTGTLIFRKQNASGLPEHEDSFEISVNIMNDGSVE